VVRAVGPVVAEAADRSNQSWALSR
jgi:hypothetical protein